MSHTLERPIVVGVAGVGDEDLALIWAARTAARTGAELVVVHSSDPESVAARMAGAEIIAVSAVLDAEKETVAGLREHVAELAGELGIRARVEMHRGSPVNALLDHQEEAALLVVGTGRKGALEEFILGSTSLGDTAHSRTPVAVVNPGVDLGSLTHGRVGVAVDGSADSARAARAAFAYAALTGAAVTALTTWYVEMIDGYVVTEPDSPEWARLEAERSAMVEETLAEARGRHPEVEATVEVRRGPVVPTIKEAAAGWDAIVVGSRGLGGVQGRLLGSVSQRLMRSAPCPVVVARAG